MSKDIQLYQVSENDLEKCLKCSICNAYCPVSGVTLKTGATFTSNAVRDGVQAACAAVAEIQ